MPNSDDFLVVAKTLVAKGQNSCSNQISREQEIGSNQWQNQGH